MMEVLWFAVIGRGRDVFWGDVKRCRLGAERVKYMRGEICRRARGDVLSVVRLLGGFAAQNRNAGAGLRALGIGGEVEIEKFAQAGGHQTCPQKQQDRRQDLERSSPRPGELALNTSSSMFFFAPCRMAAVLL